MLPEIVDPLFAAFDRHKVRLELLANATNMPGIPEILRQESARECEHEIQSIVEPVYQAIVDAEPGPAKQVSVLTDSQKQLAGLVRQRSASDGYYSIFLEGSLAAARAVYAKMISQAAVQAPHAKPQIFVSYAWGDESSEDGRKRAEVIELLCETLGNDRWNIIRDSNALHRGDLVSGFMKRIGLADHVIVVLSDKYLHSAYCMTELYSVYQRSVGEKEDFLRRIVPLILDDAQFATPRERVAYAKYWEAEYLNLKADLNYLSVEDFALYKSMQDWHNRIGDMLAYVNDFLVPHGFDEIVKDDFAELREMLSRCC